MAATRYTRGQTMHELFQWCARRRPDATAIVHGDRHVTYAELDAASDDHAAELEAAGVGPGRFVAVLMNRSPQMIAVLLAVLKRGAAYAALDGRWPPSRLARLVARLEAPLVVTDTATEAAVDGLAAAVVAGLPAPVWHLTEPDPAAAAARGRRPGPVRVGAADPAAVFFTSGSTGTPKGVVSPHAGTVRLWDDCAFADLGPGVVMPQVAPATWDGFALDCWSVLLTGGTTVLLDEPVLVPRMLRRLVEREGVNAGFLTTSLFNSLVGADVDAFAGLRWLIIGGERASAAHARRFLDRHPDARLLNIYGPAECSIGVTIGDIRPEDCADPAGIPLGEAVTDTEIHVLDGDRVCAPGETGEICLGGAGLAHGYVNDPELTARRFRHVVLDGEPRLLYRSGDLGHWSPDGRLYFDGRDDRQVKIRGHRIEPGEIEEAALGVPGIAEAVAAPIAGPDGAYRELGLFYVAAGPGPSGSGAPASGPSEEAVRAALVDRLPGYLLPGPIRRVEGLPLLANGKADLTALRALLDDAREPVDTGAAADPADGTEAEVAAAFCEVLGVPAVPPDVSFFTLGGNSLDVARLCTRLDSVLGLAVPASRVFAAQTVRELAAWADSVGEEPAPAARTAGAGEEVPLCPQQRLFLWSADEEQSDESDLCRMAWWIGGAVDTRALEAAVRDVHRRHESLHATYRGGPDATALLPDDPGEPELHHLPEAASPESAEKGLTEVLFRPLRVLEGKVWRSALVRCGERVLFGLAVHHAAFDGLSESVMARELSIAYAARLHGREPEFAGPGTVLRDLWAEYQRELDLVDLGGQRRYWLDAVPQMRGVSLAPFRTGTSEAAAGPKAAVRREVDARCLEPWDLLARKQGVTRTGCLLAVFGLVLHRLTGQEDFSVKIPVAHRGGVRQAHSVTCRVDLLCVRPKPSGGGLDHALATIGAALGAQDVPFVDVARLMARSGRIGELAAMPSFLLQDDPPPVLSLPGCEATLRRLDTATMSTELELDVRPTGAGGIAVTTTVRTDRFPASLARRITDEYVRILRQSPDGL
ncbi:amino acid adenylation domain-containing protein [Actinomadura sp. NPDC048394]|uniref:amino acid adenylation domain-containing protein n=1 Tax=Actinomadura sp. NPDC048394 TaxID=3158223 RepID=UPI0033FB0A20